MAYSGVEILRASLSDSLRMTAPLAIVAYASPVRLRNTCPVGQLTVAARRSEDERMSEVTFTAPRRSGRVFHKMRVQAHGRAHDGRKFREVCQTQVVNSHGGLLLLKHEVDPGEMLVLTNPETQEEQECRVVFLGELGDRGQRVGVEFLTPAPRFWGLEFVDGALSGSGNDAGQLV
jgi:hypothetical protein